MLLGSACGQAAATDQVDHVHTCGWAEAASRHFLFRSEQLLARSPLSRLQAFAGFRRLIALLAPHAAAVLVARRLAGLWRASDLGPRDWIVQRYFADRHLPFMLPALRRHRVNLLIDLDDNPVEVAWRQAMLQRGMTRARGCFLALVRMLVLNAQLGLFRLLLGRRLVLISPSGRNHGIAFRLWSGHVVPNVVFAVPEAMPPLITAPVIGFIGTMNHAPNVRGIAWFSEEVMPLVRRQCPGAVLKVAGRAWQGRPVSERGSLEGRPWFVALGEMDDLKTFYAQVALTVCPLFEGAGTNIKVLESLVHGRPVIGTRKSIHGISIDDPAGCVFLAGSTAAELAAATLAMLSRISDQPGRVAEAARLSVSGRYVPSVLRRRLGEAMRQALSAAG